MIEQGIGRLSVLATAAVAACLLSIALIVLSRPWLARHALARPDARSSHHAPTPQGGGIAVLAGNLVAVWCAVTLFPALLQTQSTQLLTLTATAAFLGGVGAIDDIRPLPPLLRLVLQCIAVAAVIAVLPHELRIVPQVPLGLERACLFLGGMWFINLVNFMDGIDWMTVAEVVPITGTLVVLGVCGMIGALPALVAAGLLGAILGFAPFNKPVARLFLGDVGSLPIGILLGWLLLQLAGNGHVAAALMLPLYYVADATVTLIRRIARGEPFWQAHRTHFYQRATDNGFTVGEIVARVFLANLALAALALFTVAVHHPVVSMIALAASVGVVARLLMNFTKVRQSKSGS